MYIIKIYKINFLKLNKNINKIIKLIYYLHNNYNINTNIIILIIINHLLKN